MKGTNVLLLNPETMADAVQLYLRNLWMPGNAPIVKRIQFDAKKNVFAIEIVAVEKK